LQTVKVPQRAQEDRRKAAFRFKENHGYPTGTL